MRILLITTGISAVRRALEQEPAAELIVAECNMPKGSMLLKLQQLLESVLPDLIITYRCPYILPAAIFRKARLGAFNIHPSLLPKYAGLNPWEEMFKKHEREGGITLHYMTEQADAGSVVYQYAFSISETDTVDSARRKADVIAAKLVRRLVIKWS